MDVTPLIKEGQQVIQSYKGGRFRVSGQVYETPIIVYPEYVESWKIKQKEENPAAGPAPGLKIDDFAVLTEVAQELDVVILGCGAQMAFLPTDLKNALKEQGLNVETMDTGAACRTYNVLMAEGRRVAAALLPA